MAINVDVAYNGNTIATLENVASAPITYGGNTIATLSDAGTKTLTCAGKMMSTDVVIGSKTLNCAGKVMASDILVTAESASTELYLIKNGIVQSGFTFTGAGHRYDTGGTVTPSITYEEQYGRIAALSDTVTTRKGSIYYSNSLASIISNYTMWHVRCLRYLRGNSNAKIYIGTYVEAGSTSYAPSNFKDYVYKATTSDSEVVLVENTMTSASFVNNVCFAFAWSVPSNGNSYGVYIYDVWLS